MKLTRRNFLKSAVLSVVAKKLGIHKDVHGLSKSASITTTTTVSNKSKFVGTTAQNCSITALPTRLIKKPISYKRKVFK